MAGSVNKVILVGNLGADPDVRTMQSGDRVANLSVATSERWKDKTSGQMQERTQWHRVVIFNQPLVNVAEQYLKKGAKVYLEGQLETRKWTDQSGQEKYSTEVVLRPFRGELTMLDSRGGGAMGGGDSSFGGGGSGGGYGTKATGTYGGGGFDSGAPSAGPGPMEDDIPF